MALSAATGLDVHRDKLAVGVRIRVNGKYEEHHEVCGSFTAELKRLEQRLKAHRSSACGDGIDRIVLGTGLECVRAEPLWL